VGTPVTLTGTGFTGATTVTFNGTADPTFTVVNDTTINATVPTLATTGPIAVTNSAGTGTSANPFMVTATPFPTILSFSPTHGPEGIPVTLTGTGFTGATDVSFSGIQASFIVISDTEISTLVPSLATTGTISVTNSAGTGFSPTSFLIDENTPAHITVSDGSPQSTAVNTAFAAPLQALVTDSFGNPLNGVSVTFTAPGNGASGKFSGGATSETDTTGANGVASTTFFTANATIGGPYTVAASTAGVATPANFSLTNTAGTPAIIVVTGTSSPQRTLVNTAFATTLQALVTDASGNPVSGVSVQFVAPSNGASGKFSGGVTSETDTTGANGVAISSIFTANTTAGVYMVTANVSPALATPASFIMTNLTANERFVNALYVDFLGRSGALPELNIWVALLPGIGQAGVVNGIMRSTEASTRVVDALYFRFLGRAAGGGEEMGWVNALSSRALTEEQVIADILASPEFANHADTLFPSAPPNTAFVEALYTLLLNRSADAAGLADWLNALPSLGRAGVANGFEGSAEFRGGAVRTFYGDPTLTPFPYQPFFVNLLHRTTPPRAAEVSYWVNSALDLLSIQGGFASSGEFFQNG